MKVDSGINHSPKVSKTAADLRVNKPELIGHLVLLWGWAVNFAEDGYLGDHDPADIAAAAGWGGDAELFCKVLGTHGWVEESGYLHEWAEWGGAGVVTRAESRERTRRVRVQSAQGTRRIRAKNEIEIEIENNYIPSFVEFWDVYPRKVAKRSAAKAFDAALERGAKAEDIIAGAIRYRDDRNRVAGFTCHPTTFLNGERWLDAPLPPRDTGSGHWLDEMVVDLRQGGTDG